MNMRCLDAAWLADNPLPYPDPDSDKNARGRVLVIGGANFVPGALRLTGEAALRVGAGKLQLATVESVSMSLGVLMPEAAMITLPADSQGEIDINAATELDAAIDGCDAMILGPGMSDGDDTTGFVERLLRQRRKGLTVVLDAAAIASAKALTSVISGHEGRLVMTPHMGEMSALINQPIATIRRSPETFAAEAATTFNSVVVLKASKTVIASPEGYGLTITGNCVGLATSGSGDVLAGIIGGLLARGASPIAAAAWGVWLHNAAGKKLSETMGIGFLARELLAEIPLILHQLRAD